MALPHEDRRFDAIQEFLKLNSAQQLDPVLDSLQTLRRLAKNITATEIAETDKKAKQLLKDLAGIQDELKNFKEIKQRLVEVRNYNRKDLRRKPAKPQFGNIIPFPTALKTEDPILSSEKAVTGAAASSLISPAHLEQSFQEPEAGAPEELLLQRDLSLAEEQAAVIEATPVLEDFTGQSEEDATESESVSHIQKLELQTRDQEGEGRPSRSLLEEASQKAPEAVIEADVRPSSMLSAEETVSADAGVAGAEPKPQPPAAPSAVVETAPAEAFETLAKPQQQAAPHRPQKDIEFDQGLLKELIKDYGEFDSYSSLSPAPTPAPENLSPPAAFKSAPALEPRQQETAEPSARTADFDQEVRELIKTYGKVDIYSTQADDRKRLVKRSLLAAAVLGAVFSGSYFFILKESPKQVAPQAQSEPASPQSDPLASPSGDEKNTSKAKKGNGSTANEVPNRR
jgi:hypothetical protein